MSSYPREKVRKMETRLFFSFQVSVIPTSKPSFLVNYCFDAHYIDTLLTKCYKFDESNWKDIAFVSNVSMNCCAVLSGTNEAEYCDWREVL